MGISSILHTRFMYTKDMPDYTLAQLWEKYEKLQKLYREEIVAGHENELAIERLNRLLDVMNTNFAQLLKVHREESVDNSATQ